MISRCLKLVSKLNTVCVVYSFFSCHKYTRWSHPILIYQKYLWKMTICRSYFSTDIIVYTYTEFSRNCLKNKLNITHCSECCVWSLLHYILTSRSPTVWELQVVSFAKFTYKKSEHIRVLSFFVFVETFVYFISMRVLLCIIHYSRIDLCNNSSECGKSTKMC